MPLYLALRFTRGIVQSNNTELAIEQRAKIVARYLVGAMGAGAPKAVENIILTCVRNILDVAKPIQFVHTYLRLSVQLSHIIRTLCIQVRRTFGIIPHEFMKM